MNSSVLAPIVWLTGLPGAGKTTIARMVEVEYLSRGLPVQVLDGDVVRAALWPELGFSRGERAANGRRLALLARWFARNGVLALVAAVSPFREDRESARQIAAVGGPFFEVYVRCPADVCAERDPKGLWAEARAGRLKAFTGFDAPYEEPESPDLVVRTDREAPAAAALAVMSLLEMS